LLRVCKENKISFIEQVRNGKLDAIQLSTTNLVDSIILSMHKNGILNCVTASIQDARKQNKTVPYNIIWASSIAAKMRVHTSLTDIPFAITDHRVLAELGYSLYDDENNLGQSLMTEGSIRFLVGKYASQDFITCYNDAVQKFIMDKVNIETNIHILDCTDIEVNYDNTNYEGAGLAYSKHYNDNTRLKARGYKLATLRGLVGDSGIIEEIRFGPLNTHDLTLSKDMILNSSLLKEGDVLINDRGFLSRDVINFLKVNRFVDTYVPVRKDMQLYDIAVNIAKEISQWKQNPKYKNQKIALVTDLGMYWSPDDRQYNLPDVPLNGCVIWHEDNNSYSVIVTTDLSKSAKDIIKTYCLRPEIEEDYRQLKDFWEIQDFKSTKLALISFHIVSVLFGYLFFQLFTMLPDGENFQGKSFPVLLKNYLPKVQAYFVLYVAKEFGIFTFTEILRFYSDSSGKIKKILESEIKKLEV